MQIRLLFGKVIPVLIMMSLATFAALAQTPPAPAAEKNEIAVSGKILAIDPIKGDVTVRLEFDPHGDFAKDDGTLAKTIKLDVNSSNGKQEVTFDKGKRMTPTEAVLNMYDGAVTDYPFDKHKADLILWFSVKPDKDKPKTEEPAADKPKPAEDAPVGEAKPEAPKKEEVEMNDDGEIDVPFTLTFAPSLAGFTVEAAKSKDSDDTYVDMAITIGRSSMVKGFSMFVMALMWGVSITVLLLVLSVVVRGRKVEIAMFSFIATLIFAFVALRNSQPAVPPIGTFSDYASFFGAEVILALGLLSILATWLIRPGAK